MEVSLRRSAARKNSRSGTVSVDECITYLLEKYSQYTLAHFYTLNFKQGGLTEGQIEVLYIHAKNREMEQFKMLAALQGVKIKDEDSEIGGKFAGCIQSDPKTYAHLSPEEIKEWSALLKEKRIRELTG